MATGILFLIVLGLLFGSLFYLIFETEDKQFIKQQLINEQYANRIIEVELREEIERKQLQLDILEQLLKLEEKDALQKEK